MFVWGEDKGSANGFRHVAARPRIH